MVALQTYWTEAAQKRRSSQPEWHGGERNRRGNNQAEVIPATDHEGGVKWVVIVCVGLNPALAGAPAALQSA
jgi:hypothetical protein